MSNPSLDHNACGRDETATTVAHRSRCPALVRWQGLPRLARNDTPVSSACFFKGVAGSPRLACPSRVAHTLGLGEGMIHIVKER